MLPSALEAASKIVGPSIAPGCPLMPRAYYNLCDEIWWSQSSVGWAVRLQAWRLVALAFAGSTRWLAAHPL